MPEARIQTEFGDVRVSYADTAQLQELLSQLPEQIQAIATVAVHFLPKPERLPKPGYENAYRFAPSGALELLVFPKAQTKLVSLALYAYHPEMVDACTLEAATGLAKVTRTVLGQTTNKKYFRNEGDKYGLTSKGIELAADYSEDRRD